MGFSQVVQVLIIGFSLSIPVVILVALMRLRIVPPALASVGGAIIIFLQNRLDELLLRYGFNESAMNQANYLFGAVVIVATYFVYKEIKKRQRDSEGETQSKDL